MPSGDVVPRSAPHHVAHSTRRLSRRRLLGIGLAAGAALVLPRVGTARAEPIEYQWVATKRATALWLDDEGQDVHWLPRGILLRTKPGERGARLHAWCPAFSCFGSVDAASVEDAPAPDEATLRAQRAVPVLPPVISSAELPGRVIGAANVRTWPEARPDTMVRTLGHNAPVWVLEVVEGEDGEPWYRVSDETGGPNAPRGASFFIHASTVRAPRTDFHPVSANPDRVPSRWFEADLLEPALLTAYEDHRAVWSSLALHGREPNVTPLGEHRILWRVPNETMTSERVYPPIPRNAPGGYYLENVLYTQYFTKTGAAIHYNYWSSNWGYRGSHGCLGLPLAESKWAWDWASTGTPVVVFS